MNYRLLILASVIISVLMASSCATERTKLSGSKRVRLTTGSFDVVLPLIFEGENILYDKAIPYEKLPYNLRKTRSITIGTAFAISDKELVTAAHVFNLHEFSLALGKITVRNSKGESFKIDKVTKYSQFEDIMVFTLKSYPSNMIPLKINTESEAGDDVFTVGNALGEGIVIRHGKITSYTTEPVDGRWKFIRFTAPASPGNSGGALTNFNGDVVGVVVRRSKNENLNYAVPIEIVNRLSRKMAVFKQGGYSEVEAQVRFSSPFKFKVKLPLSIKRLSKRAWKGYVRSFKRRRKKFEDIHRKSIFPNDKGLVQFSRNQRHNTRFLTSFKDKDNIWKQSGVKEMSKTKLKSGQRTEIGFSHYEAQNFRGEIYIDKPKNLSLSEFIKRPKEHMDATLEAMGYSITVGGEKVMLKSLGKPFKSKKWKDSVGRYWTSSAWKFTPLDKVFSSHCIPTPKGVACVIGLDAYSFYPLDLYYHKIRAKRMVLGHIANTSQWQEFLRLPKGQRPEFFWNSSVQMNRSKISFRFNDINGALNHIDLTKKSLLYVMLNHSIENLAKLDIKGVSILSSSAKETSFSLVNSYEPHASSSEERKDSWSSFLLKGKGLMSKKDSQWSSYQIKETNYGRSPASVGGGKKYMLLACDIDDRHSKKTAAKMCNQFKKASGFGP